MYTADDFNLDNAPREMVQYVIDNVEDFEPRYQRVLKLIDRNRCPICVADREFADDIIDAIVDWCQDNDDETYLEDGYDYDEIFG